MSLLNLNLPTIGGTNANEDPKIRTALSDIQTVVNALDNANIASGADINGSKLDDATISAAKLAANSVETAKIVNDAVTNDKIGDDAVENAQIADDAVDTAQIADGAVDTAQIADGAVTADKLASSTTATITNGPNVSGTLKARKYPGGLVILEGTFTSSSTSSFLGTLPVGYRPSTTRSYLISSNQASPVKLSALSNGTLNLSISTGAIGYVDGAMFHAA